VEGVSAGPGSFRVWLSERRSGVAFRKFQIEPTGSVLPAYCVRAWGVFGFQIEEIGGKSVDGRIVLEAKRRIRSSCKAWPRCCVAPLLRCPLLPPGPSIFGARGKGVVPFSARVGNGQPISAFLQGLAPLLPRCCPKAWPRCCPCKAWPRCCPAAAPLLPLFGPPFRASRPARVGGVFLLWRFLLCCCHRRRFVTIGRNRDLHSKPRDRR